MAPRPRDVVVVGASAGGVEALRTMVAGLPADLRASVLVVLHMPAGGTSALPAILNRVGTLPATVARNGEPLEYGRIYVSRPDHHLLVMGNSVALSHGPTENGHRPAINALFRSAAIARGASVTGVLLSGVLDDGVAGLHAIVGRGGRVVVQDPDDALYRSMPDHALRAVTPDHVVPAFEIGDVLGKISTENAEPANHIAPELLRWENEIASAGWTPEGAETVGTPSEFSCPDCQGVLSDIDRGRRYRCRVGHAWTSEALLAAQGSALERALWTALRTLEEKTALTLRMAQHARERGNQAIAGRYDQLARETTEAGEVLRQLIAGSG
jgi:two-component system chemotaxis response regulator CheB